MPLGDLQQKILKHVFECSSKAENTSHIAKSFGLAQPTVWKSIKSLIKEDYLKDTQQHKRAEKVLTLKDKGIASVIALGASLDQYERYARKVNSNDIDAIQHIKDMIENPQARDLYIQSSMERVLENSDCYFEDGMIKKHLTPLERQKLELNFQKEYLDSVGPMVNLDSVAALTNPVNLKEFMNRFDIDKYSLKGLLNIRKERIDLILKQLDAMD